MTDFSMDKQEEHEFEWQEHWFVVGSVSEKAKETIESVDGKVVRLGGVKGHPAIYPYAVCLLWHPDDADQNFNFFRDDGAKARELFITSADESHTLYFCCRDGSAPSLESDVMQLQLITEEEWFALDE